MARNDTEQVEEKDKKVRKTLAEIEKNYVLSKSRAMEKALRTDKVRYKSSSDPVKFKNFLLQRLSHWEENKDKTFHARKMYSKTKEIIDSLASC